MWTETEKYDHIQEYLEGRLIGLELLDFEHRYKTDLSFQEEVEQHRLANEAIVDHYLLQVKTTAQQVVRKKAIEKNRRNWGLGLGAIGLLGAAFYFLFPSPPPIENPATGFLIPTQTEFIKNDPNQGTVERPLTPVASEKVNVQPSDNLISPTNAQTTTEKNRMEQDKGLDSLADIQKRPAFAATSEKPANSLPTNLPPAVQTAPPKPLSKSEEFTDGRKTPHQSEAIDLIFNPLLGEQASLPLDENFNGELNVFDANGTLIFQCTIQNGYPNSWDGKSHSGGMASAGQYGFTLRATNGDQKVGYITVAK
jgi:hypothetical protein